jgi:NitT/TauT family transport system ATP-binding protein
MQSTSKRPIAKVQQPVNGEVVVREVSKSYRTGLGTRQVVRDCSFTIEKGKLTVMIGPSGCGKSTLIRLIAGFEKTDDKDGSITIDGRRVEGPGRDRLVVFQESALFPWMSTHGNVMYGPTARGESARSQDRAEALLARVGLQAFRNKYPSQLSGGMQRRAELARAMINSPAVMILDEPFRGLDAMTKVLMWEYYARLFEETSRTTFFVTTDIDEAVYLADRLLIMSNIPTRVRTVMDVDIPRPRRLSDLVEDDRANRVKMEALSVLHEEAMRSFTSGSKAASDFIEAYARRVKGA